MESRVPEPLVPLPARLAVLLSGRGSNFEALADACDRGELPGRIVLVLSDRVDAGGLEKARGRGIRALALPRSGHASRDAHEDAMASAISASGADLVCLAGFMRILSGSFVGRFPLRILNIHPSLLPAFPGLDAQEQAIRYGVRVSGATVHFVDAGTDTGPIVAQEAVPVLPEDDARALAERILKVEHRLYASAVRSVLYGGWSLQERRVVPRGSSVEKIP